MLRFSDHRNQNINNRIANMTVRNYSEGLGILRNEINREGDNDDEMDTVTPVAVLPKKKGKGYSVKVKSEFNKKALSNKRDTLKDFIRDSNILDTELNQMVTQFKITNKEEFFGGDMTSDEEEEEEQDWKTHYESKRLKTINSIDKTIKNIPAQKLKLYIETTYGPTVSKTKFKSYLNTEYPIVDEQDEATIQLEGMNAFNQELDDLKNDRLNLNVGQQLDVNRYPEASTELLKDNDVPIIRYRSLQKGDQGRLTDITQDDLVQSYLDRNNHKRSKHGVSIANDTPISMLTNEQILIAKKLNNIVNNLIPMAENLSEDHFSGATDAEINTIKKLYADMDEKMYILTSINSKSTQLHKLESDFDKLVELVESGINNYRPMSGGSMIKHYTSHKLYKPTQKVKTNYLYML